MLARLLAVPVAAVAGVVGLSSCGDDAQSTVTYFPVTQCGPTPYPLYALRAASSPPSPVGGGRAGGGGSIGGSSKSNPVPVVPGPRGASKGGGGPGANYGTTGGKTYVVPSSTRTPSVNDEIAATTARRNIVLNAGVRPPPYRTYVLSPGVYCYQEWYPIVHERPTTTTTHPAATTTTGRA